jgi:hypothetical protein
VIGYAQSVKIIILQVRKYVTAPVVTLGNQGKELAQKQLKSDLVLKIQEPIGLRKNQENRTLDAIQIVNDPSILL